MKKSLAIINMIVLLAVIFWNYLSNTGIINDTNISEISSKYQNLFTPASYAFSIWGLIYVALFTFSVYIIKLAFSEEKNNKVILKIGPWMIITHLANCAWIYAWLEEFTGLSVIIIFSILISLLILVIRLNMEMKETTRSVKIWIWQPIGIYAGWITVASIANVSAYLAKIEWSAMFSELAWTIIIIITAAVINFLVLLTRKMQSFVLVGVWALTAISVRHWNSISQLQYTALAFAGLLFISVIFMQIKKYITQTNKVNNQSKLLSGMNQ